MEFVQPSLKDILIEHLQAASLVDSNSQRPRRMMHLGTWIGQLFENVAIHTLVRGGTFKRRSQTQTRRRRHWWSRPCIWANTSTNLVLQPTHEALCVDIIDEPLDLARTLHGAGIMPTGGALSALRSKLGIIAGAPDPPLPSAPVCQFGIPSSPTFPTIDAFHVQPPLTRGGRGGGVVQPGVWRLFQMRNVQADDKREMKISDLKRFLTYVPSDVIVEVYQVVPTAHWSHAQVHPFIYRDEDGKVVPRPTRIADEFVLLIPDEVIQRS